MLPNGRKRKSNGPGKTLNLTKSFNAYYAGKLPEIDFGSIPQKEGSATRAASSAMSRPLCSERLKI